MKNKSKYVKPMLNVEKIEVNQAIADCTVQINMNQFIPGSPGLYVDEEKPYGIVDMPNNYRDNTVISPISSAGLGKAGAKAGEYDLSKAHRGVLCEGDVYPGASGTPVYYWETSKGGKHAYYGVYVSNFTGVAVS